jgi:hypothetical protein
MGPIPQMLRLVLLVGCLDIAVAMAGEEACDGPYKGRRLTPEELATVLRNHEAWLKSAKIPNDERRANLCQADLFEANFQGADLLVANLQGADLAMANLAKAIYEPYPEKLPVLWRLTNPTNELEKLVFFNTPTALIALREAFKGAGMRAQERQLTYAIEHTKQLQAWDPSCHNPKGKDTRPWLEQLAGKSESLFSYVLFELPSGYGMAPSRALAGRGLLIVLFSVPYMVAVTTRGAAGIWMVWLPDRVHKVEGETNPVRVTSAFFFSPLKMWAARRWRRGLARGLSVLFIGLYFSLLSAFSLGWRELNVGTWIARVQPREYVPRHRLGAHGGRHPVAPQRLPAGALGVDLLRKAVRVTRSPLGLRPRAWWAET